MSRVFTEQVFPVLLILVGVIAFLYVGYKLLANEPIFPEARAASALVAPFDHSQCQYPNRQSNPVDRCDNTDPACPIQKDGSELCDILPEGVSTSIIESNSSPASSQAVKTAICTGS